MTKNQDSRSKLPIAHWLFLLFLSVTLSGFSEFVPEKTQVYLTEEAGFKRIESGSTVVSFSFDHCNNLSIVPVKTGFSNNINLVSKRLDQLNKTAINRQSMQPVPPTRRNTYSLLRHKESSSSPDDLV